MAGSHTGTVTFLFTDMEGSTTLWKGNPEAMRVALDRHDEILREGIEAHESYLFKTVGEPSAPLSPLHPTPSRPLISFSSPKIGTKDQLAEGKDGSENWAAEEDVATTSVLPSTGVARLLSAGHGGQVLLSFPTQQLVSETSYPLGCSLGTFGL